MNRKRKRRPTPLGDLCENYTEKSYKRMKVSESENFGDSFNEANTSFYDQEDLHKFVEKKAKIKISSIVGQEYKVESKLPKTKKGEEEFFREIKEELEEY